MYEYTSGGVPIRIWASNNLEPDCVRQIEEASRHSRARKAVALMPDGHMGYGLPIGGVMALENAICPYAVGYDIACGMCAVQIEIDGQPYGKLEDLRSAIKKRIPLGFQHNKNLGLSPSRSRSDMISSCASEAFRMPKHLIPRITKFDLVDQLGTLGSGNHFLELQKDDEDKMWFMIHSGSRNVGHRVCTHYYNLAKLVRKDVGGDIPNQHFAFFDVDSEEGAAYIEWMEVCIKFSFLNRLEMLDRVSRAFGDVGLGFHMAGEVINIHHNFASAEEHGGERLWIHRKGATRARLGELGIIPGSQGTNSYIVKGLGNPLSFQSCSHGAGRIMGRKQAKQNISLDRFRESMGEISCDIDESKLDEAPDAYKDIHQVMDDQGDLVEIVHELTPIAVVKG